MTTAIPLMPKATAVWLVENTSLVLRADRRLLPAASARGAGDRRRRGGPVDQGPRPGSDRPAHPREHREGRGRPDRPSRAWPSRRSRAPSAAKRKGPRYTPVSRRQDRPNAILWLLRNHPELKDAAIMRLVGTTKPTIESIRSRTHWNANNLQPTDPVALGLCSQIDLDFEVEKAAKTCPAARGRRRRRDASAGVRDDHDGRRRRSCRCRRSTRNAAPRRKPRSKPTPFSPS